MSLFELRDATVQYDGVPVLSDVSLSIEQGEKIAFVGKSGAGKTTLLNLLYEQRKDISAIVPQELGLVRALTVFHNIYMGRLHLHPSWYNIVNLLKPRRKEVDSVMPIVESLGLEDKMFARIEALSGGQQQRTAVGRAIYKRCAVFFGDEPVSAVDDYQSRSVMQNIGDNHDTVILSMHDVGLAIDYSTRIIGVKNGGIAIDASTDGLKVSDLDELYND